MFSTIFLYHFLFLFFCSGYCIFRRTLSELLLFDHCRFYKVEVFYVQTNWSVHLNWMWQLFGCRQVNVSSSKKKNFILQHLLHCFRLYLLCFVLYAAFVRLCKLFHCANGNAFWHVHLYTLHDPILKVFHFIHIILWCWIAWPTYYHIFSTVSSISNDLCHSKMDQRWICNKMSDSSNQEGWFVLFNKQSKWAFI